MSGCICLHPKKIMKLFQLINKSDVSIVDAQTSKYSMNKLYDFSLT